MLKVNCTCDDSERTIKNIYVFANGEKYSGQKVVLNQNRWHHILNDITVKLDPYFGKVEKLYTTSSGLTVYSFTDLQNNATYVASNRVRRYSNVKGGYTVDTEPTQEYFEHYLSSQLQRVNKYKKLVYVRRDLLVIYLFRNGECGQSFKIVLTSDDLSSWSHILSYIALILDVPERCIKSLYSVNGNKICGPWELQHGASYVAVGYSQSFRKGCYHVDQKSTEVLTTGIPVVPKDKNLVCTHKVRRKMKPVFRWNHYDQYTCENAPTKKYSKKSRNGSRKSKRNSSQAKSPDLEDKSTKNKSTENKSTENKSTENKSTENKSTEIASKKNKKVTVHMRIKSSVGSNIMITRNSGDSSPICENKKKYKEDNSSDTSYSEDNNANSTMCDCTLKPCSTSSKKNKYHSEQTTPGSSDTDFPSIESQNNHTERNLTWKHMKNESQNSFKNGEKVTVHVQGGQAVILGGSRGNSKHSLAVKKSGKSKYGQKKQRKNSENENCERNKSILKSNKGKSRTKKNCTPSCGEDECKFYRIAKPTMDKYKPLYCPNTSSYPKPSKPKYNTILKLNRDNSDSRIKNRNYLISCKEAAKCRESPKRKTFIKRMSDFLLKSTSSMDSLKGRCRKQEPCDYSDSEDSSNEDDGRSQHNSNSHNKSSCTICRIQLEHKNLIKKYKKVK